jgi:hypothetical protein
MINIHHGFDGLDIAFQGAAPSHILEQLEKAKNQAQQERKEILLSIGKNNMNVMVAETGAKGGYAYRLDTGADGMIWFISHSINSNLWNMRVSVRSLCLVLYGYSGAKEKINDFLQNIGAIGPAIRDPKTEKIINFPIETIGRFDYCFDFWNDQGFTLTPDYICSHARTKRTFHGNDFSYNAKGKEIESVTIGKMPNRQVTIYNKTNEIRASSKNYWNDIWQDKIGNTLNTKNFENGTVWRVEVRAGKDELSQWNMRRYSDLEKMVGDIIHDILKKTRYVRPTRDTNTARWPMAQFWQECVGITSLHLSPFISGTIRHKIIYDLRQNIIKGYEQRVIGDMIGLCAAHGIAIENLPSLTQNIKDDIASLLIFNKDVIDEKHKRIIERLYFLEEISEHYEK